MYRTQGGKMLTNSVITKRFNLFALMILIIGQTILAPIASAGVVFAEGDAGDTEEPANGETEGQEEATESEEVDEAEPTDSGEAIQEENNEENEGSDEEVTSEGEEVNEPDSSESSGTDPPVEKDATEVEESEEEVEESTEEELDGVMSLMADTPEAKEFKDDDLTFEFDKIVIGGKTITEASDAANVEFSKGDQVTLSYTFEINATDDYGPESYFTFDLPTSLLDYDASALEGTIGNEDGRFEYETNGNTVTVRLLDDPLLDTQSFENGELNFQMTLGDAGNADGLEHDLVIPVKGSQTITIPLTYKPATSNKKMSKEGTSEVLQDGTRVINWTVWVNESGKDLLNAKVADNPFSQNHELDGDITVKKHTVNIDGSTTANGSTTATEFPVELDNGRFAYELTYRTKVTAEATEETESYWNEAKLLEGDNTQDSATTHATHKYGTKLDKTIKTNNKYKAKWGVKYNYFGKVFNQPQELTDTLIGPHTFVEGSVNVYPVTVDLEGNGTPDKNNPIANPDSNISTNGKTLTIELASPNGEAYYIEYETEHDENEEGYITEGPNVTNKVKYDGNEDDKTLDISENIFDKNIGDIDFDNKLVTWKLTVNPERAMNDFVITDLFESYTEGGTRQTLVNLDGTSLDFNNLEKVFTNHDKITNATLKDDETEGFELNLGTVTAGSQFTIEYRTKLDFQSSGASYGEYENTAEAKWKHPTTNSEYDVEKSADYKPTDETADNGYKNGTFDHVEQVFNWNLAVNITKQNIQGATVVDKIGEGHILIEDSIEVRKLILSTNDQKGTPGDKVDSEVYKITESDDNGFTLTFDNNLGSNNNEAYIITYQTEDEDEIIGQKDGSNEYSNEATFTSGDGGEFELKASTTVKNANKLIDKDVNINNADETITWTIDVNESHSELGNIVLTDNPSNNQLILEDTFRKREILMDAAGKIAYGAWEDITPTSVDHDNNEFTIDLGNLDKKGYQIEYTTFFQGAHEDEFSNEASINWEGVSTGTTTESDVGQKQFLYATSSGNVSSTKGTINLKKVGLNPLTGDVEALEGIEFHLKTINGKYKLAEATTDSDGKLTIGDVRYGTYQLEELNPDADRYLPLNDNPTNDQNENSIVITLDNDLDGKEFTVENIEDVEIPPNTCDDFTLTVNDVDGEGRDDVQLKLVNENTGKTVTDKTDTDGKVKIPRADLPAGPYKVYEIDSDGNETELDTITVNYVDCGTVIKPAPTCDAFTITLKINDEPREGEELTIVVKDGDVKEDDDVIATETTGTNGSFTVPSKDLPAGTYDVYKDEKKIGTVDVSYSSEPCEAEVTLSSSEKICPNDTITVKKSNGQPDTNVEVTIVDEDGNEVTYEDQDGNTVDTFTTDDNGQIKTDEPLEHGKTYEVYKGNKKLGEFTKDLLDCEYEVKPR